MHLHGNPNPIHEYLDVDHMKRVYSQEVSLNNNTGSYYLPHHAVVRPESSTTRLRVVFNASNPTQNGNSLNDVLHTGPSLQQDLLSLMLRWRTYRYVFNADIAKMYRQIRIHPSQTSYQRILFRTSSNKSIEDFELQTVTFGVNCAPYLAIRTLLKLADDEESKYPLGSKMLRNDFYVDDLLSGSDTLEQSLQAQSEIISILASAGFVLRKWTANNRSLLDHIPKDQILNDLFLNLTDQSSVKTLGVFWNAKTDSFYFKINPISFSSACTKREVFSHIAKLFDPAGWTAPVIIKAKILMQQIWKDKTLWDENLKPHSLSAWESFTRTFTELSRLKIPRWLGTDSLATVEIHGFCDASEVAYAAVIFVKVIYSSVNIRCQLMCAKTKVAPVNTISLPRLELCGAVLLSKLMKNIQGIVNAKIISVYLWTDSSIVLAWLEKPPCSWQTFIANRTSLIKNNVGDIPWRHVSSADNPADLATRGMAPGELLDNDLWWHGPIWLRTNSLPYPCSTRSSVNEADLESKPIKSFHTFTNNSEDILQRFSSFPKALRVISYIFRFYTLSSPRFKVKPIYTNLNIQRNEILYVKERLISLSQRAYFPSEYKNLESDQSVNKSSQLLTLHPVLDLKGIMRVNGRLVNSSLTWAERYPIILPYNSIFAKLLVDFMHEITLHGGNQLIFILIRQEYWVPKLKNLIKTRIHKCKICVIHKKQQRSQLMAALPPERTDFSNPFSKVGIDFAGPFEIKTYFGRSCRITKGYVCIFVCFSTKAIHLEETTELSTPSFLAAFYRFVGRRGLPRDIYSDNGTNFVGANRALKEDFKASLKESALQFCNGYNNWPSWHFIPPGAPHMGGLWEAGVKSFKTHFKKVATSYKYTFEEFTTLLCRIESCLNSRPISAITENPFENLSLTPGHFLIGRPLLSIPEPNLQEPPISLINRWEKLKFLHQTFCKRWKEEYLKELHKRYKWKFPQRDIEAGDIVVVRKENLPPNEWRLGRVTKVFPGNDGRVRVARIQTQQGEITRPIVKLCVIPTE